ncbi:hypothetical protein JTB14_018058 [Gonioctena quinquepunctata]|nr:hypothetical protein JTB14_018058 [Gonioctena quinquepunctata]
MKNRIILYTKEKQLKNEIKLERRGRLFFCNKRRKTVPVVPKAQRWLETVKDKATDIDDSSTLDKIEAVAGTVGYHQFCKIEYLTKCRCIKNQQKSPKAWHDERDYHSGAFEQLCTECEALPDSLNDLLQIIICGDSTLRKGQHSKKNVISSIAQDIVYATTTGNLETSKHVCLGIAMKSLTNGKEIVDLLNCFGHCISYTAIPELETEATLTGVAFDNYDRFVETLTGKDTLHDTVGIIHQNIDDSEEETSLPTDAHSNIDLTSVDPVFGQSSRKRKRRTFDAILPEIAP